MLTAAIAGEGVHRSGWPAIVRALTSRENGRGLWLDDFADGSYSYRAISSPRSQPWGGIFHHPVTVESPITSDQGMCLRNAAHHPHWTVPARAVALTEEGRNSLSNWLGIPVIALKHGIDRDVPRWRPAGSRDIVQIGSTLRNTRAIFDFHAPGWTRSYLRGASPWSLARDRQLQAFGGEDVADLPRLSDHNYDELLSSCIVFSEYFAVSASNLILECLVRGTPLIINRLPAIEEYLGPEYPLYRDCLSLTDACLRETHDYLLDRSKLLPTVTEFAESVQHFLDEEPVR